MPPTDERTPRGGRPAVSIEDVAVAAGVSTATVSRAVRGLPRVSPATRDRVQEAASRLGYVASSFASGLATGRTRTIGVVAPAGCGWFSSKAIDGAARVLNERNYTLSLFNSGGNNGAGTGSLNSVLLGKRTDGLLLLTAALSAVELLQIRKLGIPLIALGNRIQDHPFIGIDQREAMSTAVRHLLALGHRDIALLYGGGTDTGIGVTDSTRQTFREVMSATGLGVRPDWEHMGDPTVYGGQKAFSRFWAQSGPKPTAILCSSDEMAMGVMFEAGHQGVAIPADLSVIGIDDHDYSVFMGLSTVAQDPGRQGQLAATMLLDEVEGQHGALGTIIAEHRLIPRHSTAPLRL
ncbi:LacI family DNA-binding transcriptional regulator [Pseudarthrobacter sp. N5]|uniref:LacI family DNA-binding transcriptional regulator n=1 Tax=Pseudarthrobacter sp. N5 TaxID=3418416 RepID=UPI003CE80919